MSFLYAQTLFLLINICFFKKVLEKFIFFSYILSMEDVKNVLVKLWEEKFSHIYCLHYLPYKDRVKPLLDELKRVGLLQAKNFSFKYTFDSPFYDTLMKMGVRMHHAALVNKRLFRCTMGHYFILKEAEGLDYQNILIIEDDVNFLKDLSLLRDILEHTPEKADVILYDKWPFNKEMYDTLLEKTCVNGYYHEFKNCFSSGAMYALSHGMIRKIIREQEKSLKCADVTYWDLTDNMDDIFTRYFAHPSISIQDSKGDYDKFYESTGLKKSDYGA